MKLIVQIPCLNEAETLPATVADVPREIEGIDRVEILVVDDGSTDGTVEVARELGVDHVVRLKRNQGLARAFVAGLDASLLLGADIIVNTDGDNQYCGADIPNLIRPILDGAADMVIGDRQVDTIEHFSPLKKRLQRFGSWTVRRLSGTRVTDTTSGFRAYSREAALALNLVTDYSYTLESIIQAGARRMAIAETPVRTNEKLRESRLMKSIPDYLRRSGVSIVRATFMEHPLTFCLLAGSVVFGLGALLGLRFFYFYMTGDGAGHVQSVILASILLVIGFQTFVLGLVADLIAANRRLIEAALIRIKRIELGDSPTCAGRSGGACEGGS